MTKSMRTKNLMPMKRAGNTMMDFRSVIQIKIIKYVIAEQVTINEFT